MHAHLLINSHDQKPKPGLVWSILLI